VSVGVVLGAFSGAVYAGLVGAVHFGVDGHWDRVPVFALGSVLAGALLGGCTGVARALLREVERTAGSSNDSQAPSVGAEAFTDGDLSEISDGTPVRVEPGRPRTEVS
jgi:hypothetical protein